MRKSGIGNNSCARPLSVETCDRSTPGEKGQNYPNRRKKAADIEARLDSLARLLDELPEDRRAVFIRAVEIAAEWEQKRAARRVAGLPGFYTGNPL